jgi:hypothetical protein
MENEIIWKKIPDYNNYEASNTGLIRSRKFFDYRNETKITYLEPLYPDGRYASVWLYKDKQRKRFTVHYLVAITFLGPKPPDKDTVNHKDGFIRNNNVDNLEWATYSENMIHAVRVLKTGQGANQSGAENHAAKLTEVAVLELRSMPYKRRSIMNIHARRAFAEKYGISKETVNDIIHRRSWTHI